MTKLADAGPGPALDEIRGRLRGLRAPAELQAKLADHIVHLQQVAASLQSLGLDDETIGQEVLGLFESYQIQLVLAISNLSRAAGLQGARSS